MALSAVSLGSCIGGIPVTLHYSFFLLLLIEFVYSIRYTQTTPPYPMLMLFVLLFYGPILLLTILVHEFGHALVTQKLGGTVGGIVLWPLGGFALCGPTDSLGDDLKVAAAGPATHVPMGFIWWLVYLLCTGSEGGWWPSSTIYLDVLSSSAAGFFAILSSQAIYLNIVLLFFNLFIPAYPLDGGRIYAASLMLVFKLKGRTAAKVTAVTALLISAGMMVYALICMLAGTAGSELMLGLVGAFVFYTSYELFAAAKRDDLGGHPIFGRECYREDGGGGGGNAAGAGVGDEEGVETVPAQTEEAVIT